jgi:group I intron endonuclease
MYNIYGIYNKINGKIYIGITNNLKRRWSEHKKLSKKITEHSYAVHLAIKKYGLQNFILKKKLLQSEILAPGILCMENNYLVKLMEILVKK